MRIRKHAAATQTGTKQCTKCRITKPLVEFTRATTKVGGYQSGCKECAAKEAKERYQADPEYRELKNAATKSYYAKLSPQEKKKLFKHPPYEESRRKYRARNKELYRDAVKRWYAKNPLARQAHLMVANAIKSGKLIAQPCIVSNERCGGKIEAHHDDYSKPLQVEWMCKIHHEAWHRIFIPEGQGPKLNSRSDTGEKC